MEILPYKKWEVGQHKAVGSSEANVSRYQSYVSATINESSELFVSDTEQIRDRYISAVQLLLLNHTTNDEKRYILNLNLNNPDDLRSVAHLFSKKLRDVCKTITSQRQHGQFTSIQYILRGTQYGLSRKIFNEVIEYITTPFLNNSFDVLTPLYFSDNFNLEINELYDTYQSYNNINPTLSSSNSIDTRFDTFLGNVVPFTPDMFLDLQRAILQLSNSFPVYILETGTGKKVKNNQGKYVVARKSIITNGIIDYTKIPKRYFLYGDQTADSFILNTYKILVRQLVQTDFYFLSTGYTQVSSLFTPLNPNFAYENTNFPTIVQSQSDTGLKDIWNIGGYFTPEYITYPGLITKNTSFQPPNSATEFTYFPNISAVPYTGKEITLYNDTQWIISSLLNGERSGFPTNSIKIPTLQTYISKEEINHNYEMGLCRVTDDIQFFTERKKNKWNSGDVFKEVSLGVFPISSRNDTLLIKPQTIYSWQTDYIGNEFGLYKNIERLKTPTTFTNTYTGSDNVFLTTFLSPTANSNGISVTNYNNVLTNFINGIALPLGVFYYRSSAFDSNIDLSLFNSQVSTLSSNIPITSQLELTGSIVIRSKNSSIIGPLSATLSGVFVKYTNPILAEIYGHVVSFIVEKNSILIQTPNYVVFEKYQYNAESNTFESILPSKIYITL